MMNILSSLSGASTLNTILLVCILIGGLFAIRSGKRGELLKFQKETIEALQQRIDALEGKVADFEKENVIQRHIIDTITSALKQRGMVITIDGDMVTIQDSQGMSQHRKRGTITTQQSATVIKKEEL